MLVVELHHWHKGYTDEEKNRTALVLEQMRMNGVYVPQNYFSDA